MSELYEKLGFNSNPFETFSAEDETSSLNSFYIKPKKYNSILKSINKNTTNYIFAKRGNGKTALLYSLINDLDFKNSIHIVINDFSEVDIKKEKTEISFLKLTIKKLVETLILRLINNRNIIDKINNKVKRDEIATIIFSYLESISKESYLSEIERIKGTYTSNNLKSFFNNYLINISNSILSSGLDMLSTTIANSIGMQSFVTDKEHQYIKSLKIDKLRDISSDNDIKLIFNKLISLIQDLGFSTIAIFVDRIDEYQLLETLPKKISSFVHPITGNTTLTKDSNFSFQFLLWDKLKEPMEQLGVRFDKVVPISIDLTNEELKNILMKRLEYYSSEKISNLGSIMNADNIDIVYELADNSPRDLLRLLHFIYNEQENIDDNSDMITKEAFEKGLEEFIYEYNFYYNYPIMSENQKFTVYEFIGNLYTLKKIFFTLKEYAEICGFQNKQAENQIERMIEMKLICKLRLEGKTTYKVLSNLLTYAINRDMRIKNVNSE
ncbi:P-loop ATPase, Sll1717 family [Aliarcobacter cryaerophilus]|uniref:P-loop ATPase, Sll1717 family n=1 Tax=Aliarcobacter cryaerophilus TaxID=28198 RepID=UPI003DA4A136